VNLKIFKNKTVLVTGHTGFKGSWLSIWLNSLGAKVVGLSIDIPTEPSIFSSSLLGGMIEDHRHDIRDIIGIKKLVNQVKPDFVFHLAAQALVRKSYEDPLETMSINALGSVTILEAIRQLDKKVIAIMITSDKAYDNVEWMWGYRETDRLGGKDPYSASKGMAELAIRSFVESFFNTPESNIRVGVTRAGNVIGGGDWAKDRIVPDCMRSWSKNEAVDIRSPNSTRPWQHVLEPLSGYLTLAHNLSKDYHHHGEAYNFGPTSNQNYPVSDLINEMSKYWDKVKWNDISKNKNHLHEAGLLKLNCDKALFDLNWRPTLDFSETVKITTEWYKSYYQNPEKSMYEYTISQINNYVKLAENKKIPWALND
jgi:CDP-glucose 4,6-dehydratase